MGGIGSGRHTNEEEEAKTIKTKIELISNEALIELAKSKVFNQIRQLGRGRKALKNTVSVALPVLLRSIREHKQVDIVEVKPLLSAIRGEVIDPKQLKEAFNVVQDVIDDTKQIAPVSQEVAPPPAPMAD